MAVGGEGGAPSSWLLFAGLALGSERRELGLMRKRTTATKVHITANNVVFSMPLSVMEDLGPGNSVKHSLSVQ